MIFELRHTNQPKSSILTKIFHTLPIHRIDRTLGDITFSKPDERFIMNGDTKYTFRGKGGYGSVFVNENNTEAIKILVGPGQPIFGESNILNHISKLTEHEISDYYNISSLICDENDTCNYFCKFINAYYKRVKIFSQPLKYELYIRMEYCGQNLMTVLLNEKIRTKLTQDILLNWFVTIAKGIQCMHVNNYVHLDIKPDNITVIGDLTNLSQCRVKIIDFGLARSIDKITEGLHIGTRGYAAPEMDDDLDGPTGEDCKKCDIYSLGMTFGMCLKSLLPPTNLNSLELQKMIERTRSDRITIDKVVGKLTSYVTVHNPNKRQCLV